jgi:hypothetical protein
LRRSPIRRRSARVPSRLPTTEDHQGSLRRPLSMSPGWRQEYIRRFADRERERDSAASNHSAAQPQLPSALQAQFSNALQSIDSAIAQASRTEAAYTSRPLDVSFPSHGHLVSALRRSANFRSDANLHRRRIVDYEGRALRGELTVHPTTTAMTVREVVCEIGDIVSRVGRDLQAVRQDFSSINGIDREAVDLAQTQNMTESPIGSPRDDAADTGSNGNWPLRENSSLSLNASLSHNVASLAAVTAERYPLAASTAPQSATSTIAELASLNLPSYLEPTPSSFRSEASLLRAAMNISSERSNSSPPPAALLTSGHTESDGLGDRNRSPSPLSPGVDGADRIASEPGQNDPRAWDSLLATVAPDNVLPSADSTFTAATASFEAGSTSGILQRVNTRGTTSSGPGSGISSRSSWATQITAASSHSSDENDNANDDDCEQEQTFEARLGRYPINPHYRAADRIRRRSERNRFLASASNTIVDDSASSSSASYSGPRITVQPRTLRRQHSTLGTSQPTQPTQLGSNRVYTPSEALVIEADIRDLSRSRIAEPYAPYDAGMELVTFLNGLWPADSNRVRLIMWNLSDEADEAGLSDPASRNRWMMAQARLRFGDLGSHETRLMRLRAAVDEQERLRLAASSRFNRRSTGAGLPPRRRTTEMEGSRSRQPQREERLVLERVESPGAMSDDGEIDVDMNDVEMRMVVDGDIDELDIIGRVVAPRRGGRRGDHTSTLEHLDLDPSGMPWMSRVGALLGRAHAASRAAAGTPSVTDAAALRLPSVLDIDGPAPTSAVREERTGRRHGNDIGRERL